jgi:hypothetical protein
MWDEIARRLGSLPASRGGLVLLAANVLTALVCWFVPLANHLGFEFAFALTAVNAILAPAVGVAAIHAERLRLRSERSYRAAALAAVSYASALLVVPTGLMALNAWRAPSCEPGSGALWIVILALPTTVIATATGALARSLTEGNFGAGLLVFLVEAASLAWSLSTLYRGPSFFLFDHYFGYFPGPLYDEVILFSTPLLVFRALTLLWAWVLILICDAVGAEWSSDRFSRGVLAAVLACALLFVSFREGTRLGFRTTDRSLADALGATRTIDKLEVHYPREWNEQTTEAFLHDAAFRASQVMRDLSLTDGPTVRVWVYRSAEEKRRLVGAATTSFSKPWRHEIHINADAFPHPVLRHELIHAFGAEIAHGPFGTPGGLFPNSPLVEGFAEALDVDTEGLTLLQWAKAMRDLHLAPQVEALFSTSGFYAAAPARAYTYAGAFLRFLDAKFGRARLLDLYATGDLTRLGKPAELVDEFNKTLDGITITPAEKATGERHLARPSVFHRRCAREVSALTDKASGLLSEGRKDAALALYERVSSMEPDDPALLEYLLRAAIQAKDPAVRDQTAARILSHPHTDSVLRAQTLMELGDDLWRQHATADAAVRYRDVIDLAADAPTHRAAGLKHETVLDPLLNMLLQPLLADSDADLRELFAMNDFVTSHPGDRIVRYLLGRQLVQRAAIARGLPLLETTTDRPLLGDAELAKETLRLIVRGDAELHRCADSAQAQLRLQRAGGTAADQEVADDWVARCRFEVSRSWPASTDVKTR